MKDIINKLNKKSIEKVFLLKLLINIFWFGIAILFILFVNEDTTKSSLIFLSFMLIIFFAGRLFTKKKYNSIKNDTYYDIKHEIELFLFKRIGDIKRNKIYETNKEELSRKVLQFTFNLTKMIYDIESVIIPLCVSYIIIFIVTAKISVIFAILLTIMIIVLNL